MVPQPMLTCSSVSRSSQWYQRTLGLTSAHGGDEYEMLMHGGALVLQLHEVDADEHPYLVRRDEPFGNGVAVWFESTDDAAAVERARGSGAEILEDDHENPLAHHREIWLRDPDGYIVVVSSPFGQTEEQGCVGWCLAQSDTHVFDAVVRPRSHALRLGRVGAPRLRAHDLPVRAR